MTCILSIIGENFDVDSFIAQCGVKPYGIFYKDQLIHKDLPKSKKNKFSGCSIGVSSAGFDEFNKQVDDAISYLNLNQKNLKLIPSISEIQFATLNFGIEYDIDKFVQSKYLPNTLLTLCADLGIGIELSIYQQTENEI
ncbi:hypothetical protein [Mucilaginibacter aquariorum]|uniref:DUF4279 domain-containing protein n=1 Tax=Mucilaginibacter aquariorum TaxID=2967225 RepID=A0ABT1T6V3_9SPHI|nr:hypothetical protein [Mucilaginibacter aquariorum]MCQ6960362.1 hypothetical protein [Mucilaginibacter aquariorum]